MNFDRPKLLATVYGAGGVLGGPLLVAAGVVTSLVEWTLGLPLVVAGASLFLAGVVALPVVRATLASTLDRSAPKYVTGSVVAGFSGVTVLAVGLSLALFAGAAMTGLGFHQAGDGAWDVERSIDGRQVEGTVSLTDREYGTVAFESATAFEFVIRVQSPSGRAVDVYVMDRAELDYFRSGKGIVFRTALSREETTGYVAREHLDAGEYVVVVDNTVKEYAKPDGKVTVEISFELS